MATHDPYQFLGKVYDRLFEPAAARIRAQCLQMCPPQPDRHILDLGCGTGTHLSIYQQVGSLVSGVDMSPTMLAQARAKLGSTADLRLENATHLSFPVGAFELVILMLTLHEMAPDIRPAVLQEVMRVLNPRGSVLVADYHPGPYPMPEGWFWKAIILGSEVIAGREHYYSVILNKHCRIVCTSDTIWRLHDVQTDLLYAYVAGWLYRG